MQLSRHTHWIGHRRSIGWQQFEVVDVRPYRCRGGRDVLVLIWRSTCAECGVSYQFQTARKPQTSTLTRRCAAHHVSDRKFRRLRRKGRPVPLFDLLEMLTFRNAEGEVVSGEACSVAPSAK